MFAIKRRCGGRVSGATIREGSLANCRLIRVVGRSIAGKDVSALVADVANGYVYRWSYLTLDRGIPLVDRWEPLSGWPDSRADVTRRSPEWKNAIRGNCDRRKSQGSLGQRKYGTSIIRRTGTASYLLRAVCIRQRLVCQNRKVLRHHVSEVRSEYADVKSASVADTQNGFRIELISKAESRRESLVCVVHISVQVISADAGHTDDACIDVREAALGFTVYTLREVDFPAQAVSHRKFRRYAPRILAVEEPALLAFRSVQARTDEPLEGSNVAQQEGCKTVAACAAIRCVSGIDVQQPRPARIARRSQVHRITDVSTELDLVVALGFRPVVDELELLFAFRQRAIAAANI